MAAEVWSGGGVCGWHLVVVVVVVVVGEGGCVGRGRGEGAGSYGRLGVRWTALGWDGQTDERGSGEYRKTRQDKTKRNETRGRVILYA